jgi:hypothetical protein
MNVKGLRFYLNHLYELDEKHDELTLTVVTIDSSIVARSHVFVRSAAQGFEWEYGLLLLITNTPISKKKL